MVLREMLSFRMNVNSKRFVVPGGDIRLLEGESSAFIDVELSKSTDGRNVIVVKPLVALNNDVFVVHFERYSVTKVAPSSTFYIGDAMSGAIDAILIGCMEIDEFGEPVYPNVICETKSQPNPDFLGMLYSDEVKELLIGGTK